MRRVRPAGRLADRVAAAVAGCVAAAVAGCAAPVTAVATHARPGRPPVAYYLALGDSLAQGVQPGPSGVSAETARGYADQLYALLRGRQPGLRLVKLGCPGETTATMINGGTCRYPGGSQLAAAVSFLAGHRGRVRLVTMDIGANDATACLTEPAVGRLASCARTFIPRAAADLNEILTRLRQAGPAVRMVAMNYYLPALAQWRHGMLGQALARLTELAAAGYNAVLGNVYQAYGVGVADVFGAFHTADFADLVSLAGLGTLPRNVAAICEWTWECAAPPRGPNQHANQAGYAVIARAFLQAGAG